MEQRPHEISPAAGRAPPFSLNSEQNPWGSSSRWVNGDSNSDSVPDIPSNAGSSMFSLVNQKLSGISTRESCSPEFGVWDELGPPAHHVSETKLEPSKEEHLSHGQPAAIITSLLPYLQSPSIIPCQTHTPLSPLGLERFCPSNIILPELDFKLCAFFLVGCYRDITGLTISVQPSHCTTVLKGGRDLFPRS